MACDCGREAPPAVIAAVEAPTTDANHFEASYDAAASSAASVQTATAAWVRLSTTPPSPLIFLIDCAFLT
jgi:hypothetical protein